MIAKKFRLCEHEVKKVLRARNAQFSDVFIGNIIQSKGESSRFALVLSSKATKTSIDRNFFRRRFFEFIRTKNLMQTFSTQFDVVCLPKKWKVFSRRNIASIDDFDKWLTVLMRRISQYKVGTVRSSGIKQK
jgi:ribonuclease P protein component